MNELPLKVNIFERSKKIKINKKKLIQVVKKTVRIESQRFSHVNIIITTDNYLKKLNRQFLKKNRPTNVIAFNLVDMAEIYVSADRAHEKYDLYYFIIHGLLHVCGYRDRSAADQKLIDNKTRQLLKYA